MRFKRNISILSIALAFTGAALNPSFANNGNLNPNAAKVKKAADKSRFSDLDSKGALKLRENDFAVESSSDKAELRVFDSANGRTSTYTSKKASMIPMEQHDTDQIGYVVKGQVKAVIGTDNKEETYNMGDYFFIPAKVRHSMTTTAGTHFIAFNPATNDGNNKKFEH